MFGFLGLFSSTPSKGAFSKLIIKEVAKAGIPSDFTYSKETFTFQQGSTRIFLGNVYAAYCKAKTKEERIRLIRNFLEPLQQQDREISREEALEKAVAVIRERALFSFLSLYWQIDDVDKDRPHPASEPISDWYCKAIVLDYPGHVRVVNEEDLEEWGLSFDELFEVGLARLDECSTPQFRQENGYFVGTWNDDYDSSRILLPSLFEDLPIEGEPVFVTPNKLTLMVADSKNEAAMKAMLARAEEIVTSEPRPQNPGPLCYRDGKLQDYAVAPTSRIFNEVERAKKVSALSHYEEQTERLLALYEKTGKDLFVDKYQLVQKDDGSYFSRCVWSKGVPTLLPKTDIVMFFDPDKPENERLVVKGEWEQVCAVAGDLMLDTEMFPPRYYVSRFPTEEQVKAITASKSLQTTTL